MREEISAALFARLGECTAFITTGRRLPGADEVPGSAQPAFFLGSPTESYGWSTRGGAPLRRLMFTAWVYCFADGAHNAVPSTQINTVLDAFEAALQPDPLRDTNGNGERCTLGGLVHDCRIEGNIDTDEGLLGPQGFARIPIIVVIP